MNKNSRICHNLSRIRKSQFRIWNWPLNRKKLTSCSWVKKLCNWKKYWPKNRNIFILTNLRFQNTRNHLNHTQIWPKIFMISWKGNRSSRKAFYNLKFKTEISWIWKINLSDNSGKINHHQLSKEKMTGYSDESIRF